MPRIVVLQTAPLGASYCFEVLSVIGLVPDTDFVVTSRPAEVKPLIKSEEKQLFVTGSFNGQPEGAESLVAELRAQNPNLVCASFSLLPLEGTFERVLMKRPGRDELKELVEDFLRGKITRTD